MRARRPPTALPAETPDVTSVAPIRRGERLRCEATGVALEVDPSLGGRVVEFSLNGRNALFVDHRDSHGSTFWTSPQRDWGWPPPSEIDRDPYSCLPSKDAIVIESRCSPAVGVSVQKCFRMANDGAVAIVYTLRNDGGTARAVAPWEVTRVPRSGVSFFSGGTRVGPSAAFPAPAFTESDGLVSVDHRRRATGDRKLFAETSSGWLAHVAERLLFLKTFEARTGSACAPGEGDVEIFVSGAAPYVELEQQGTYRTLEPGESTSWSVSWRLFELAPGSPLLRRAPDDLAGSLESAVALVRRELARRAD